MKPVQAITFTKDQDIAINQLLEFINKPYTKNDYKIALTGAAGTGKTFSLKYMIDNCGYSHSVIGLSAPTHKACRVLKEATGLEVKTIQSDLGLRLSLDVENFDINNPPFDPRGKMKIGDYRVYIVDEASMVNNGLRTLIEREALKYKVKLIYTGDPYQLAPVKEKYSSCFRNINTVNLKQIVRQGENNPLSPLLEMLRYDILNKKYSFINYIYKNRYNIDVETDKGYALLNKEQFAESIQIQYSNEEFTKNIDLYKVVGYTNASVNSWNKFIRMHIIADAERNIITKNDLLTSYTTIVDDYNSPIIKNSEEYIVKDIVNYVNATYDLKGFMVKFTCVHGGDTTAPLFIIDHNDRNSIVRYYQIINSLINTAKNANKTARASAWKTYYSFKDSILLATNIINNVTGEIIVSRDIDYGFSLTAHKSQGSTYSNVFVDINDIVFDKNSQPYVDVEDVNRRLYVALSRAKNKAYLSYGR